MNNSNVSKLVAVFTIGFFFWGNLSQAFAHDIRSGSNARSRSGKTDADRVITGINKLLISGKYEGLHAEEAYLEDLDRGFGQLENQITMMSEEEVKAELVIASKELKKVNSKESVRIYKWINSEGLLSPKEKLVSLFHQKKNAMITQVSEAIRASGGVKKMLKNAATKLQSKSADFYAGLIIAMFLGIFVIIPAAIIAVGIFVSPFAGVGLLALYFIWILN